MVLTPDLDSCAGAAICNRPRPSALAAGDSLSRLMDVKLTCANGLFVLTRSCASDYYHREAGNQSRCAQKSSRYSRGHRNARGKLLRLKSGRGLSYPPTVLRTFCSALRNSLMVSVRWSSVIVGFVITISQGMRIINHDTDYLRSVQRF